MKIFLTILFFMIGTTLYAGNDGGSAPFANIDLGQNLDLIVIDKAPINADKIEEYLVRSVETGEAFAITNTELESAGLHITNKKKCSESLNYKKISGACIINGF